MGLLSIAVSSSDANSPSWPLVMERTGPMDAADRSFDVEFWQRLFNDAHVRYLVVDRSLPAVFAIMKA